MLHPRGRAWLSIYALALLAAAMPLAGVAFCADESAQPTPAASQQPPEPTPDANASEPSFATPEGDAAASTDHVIRIDQPVTGEPMGDGYDDGWTWQWVPTGLIYHSYMAGPHEPRAGITAFSDGDSQAERSKSRGPTRRGKLQLERSTH